MAIAPGCCSLLVTSAIPKRLAIRLSIIGLGAFCFQEFANICQELQSLSSSSPHVSRGRRRRVIYLFSTWVPRNETSNDNRMQIDDSVHRGFVDVLTGLLRFDFCSGSMIHRGSAIVVVGHLADWHFCFVADYDDTADRHRNC